MVPSATARSGDPIARMQQDISFLLPLPEDIPDDMQEIPAECYDDAIEGILRRLASHPGVLCVARFGTVNLPGVSDIDLFIICRDESYVELRGICDRLIQEVPFGSSLFVHQMLILPYSLRSLRRILFIPDHPFDSFHVLWGNAALLEESESPSFPVAILNTIIWHSAIWRTVLTISHDQRGTRRLLLLLRLLTMHSALNERFLGDERQFHAVQSEGRDLRRTCLLTFPPDRPRVVREALRVTLAGFLKTEWQLQRWWRRGVWPEERIGVFLPSLEGKEVRFEEFPRHRSSDVAESCLFLPSFYADGIGVLAESFAGLSPLLPSLRVHLPPTLSSEWQAGFRSYQQAVFIARAFSKRVSGDPFFIFTGEKKRGIFPTPFAL